jgi:hypothetical protein
MNEPRYSGLDLHQDNALKQQVNLSAQEQKPVGSSIQNPVNFNPIKNSFV